MSQGSLIIPTTGTLSGLALVQAINAALANESSQASGATDPSTLAGGVQPFSLWADTSVTPNTLRLRNGANTAWIVVGDLTQPNLGLVQGMYGARGLTGANNATTPNTKYDLVADAATLRNPSNGAAVTRTNTGTITNDTGLAGPAANGRDQAGAFGASSWIHFYFIWNGTTLATLSSLVAPATGPTLPTGYTHWAYAGAVYYNATPLLVKTRIRGAMAFYDSPPTVLSAGGGAGETSISLTTVIPPNALESEVSADTFSLQADGTGNAYAHCYLKVITGVNYARIAQIAVAAAANASHNNAGKAVRMPNVVQNIFYQNTLIFGSTPAITLVVNGYKMPNGGE